MAAKEEKDPEWPVIDGPLRIFGLRTVNFMVLKTVDIQFGPHMNRLASKENAQGKSSILRIIELLQGLKHAPDEPIHRGEKKSVNVIDLGEIVVKIEFKTSTSPSISVFTKDGKRIDQPVRYLQTLINGETFNPRKFAFEMDNAARADKLRGIAGLSFDDLEAERKRVFEDRTGVNRDAKSERTRAEAMPYHAGKFETKDEGPATLVLKGVSDKRDDLNGKLRKIDADETTALVEADRLKSEADTKRAQLDQETINIKQRMTDRSTRRVEIEAEIKRLESERAQLDAADKTDATELENMPAYIEGADERVSDVQEARLKIKKQFEDQRVKINAELAANTFEAARAALAEIQSGNTKAKENAARAASMKKANDLDTKSEKLTGRIEEIDALKKKRITEASALIGSKVPGLAIDDEGVVMMNEVPFDQDSTAERWCAAVMLGIAMNPKLKVVLIEDASLLSDKSFRDLYAVAVEKGVQFIVEEAGRNAGEAIEGVESCVFMIEDGGVVTP